MDTILADSKSNILNPARNRNEESCKSMMTVHDKVFPNQILINKNKPLMPALGFLSKDTSI